MVAATFVVLAVDGSIGVSVGAVVRNEITAVAGVLVRMLAVEHIDDDVSGGCRWARRSDCCSSGPWARPRRPTRRGPRWDRARRIHRPLLNPDCGFATFADNPIVTAEVAEAHLAVLVAARNRLATVVVEAPEDETRRK